MPINLTVLPIGSRLLSGSAPILLELDGGLACENFCGGPAVIVATGVFRVIADAGAAVDEKSILFCEVMSGSGVSGPEAGRRTRGGSQSPGIPAVQVDHAGSIWYNSDGTDNKGEQGSYVIKLGARLVPKETQEIKNVEVVPAGDPTRSRETLIVRTPQSLHVTYEHSPVEDHPAK